MACSWNSSEMRRWEDTDVKESNGNWIRISFLPFLLPFLLESFSLRRFHVSWLCTSSSDRLRISYLINPDLSCWPLLRIAAGYHYCIWLGNRWCCIRRTCPYCISRFAAVPLILKRILIQNFIPKPLCMYKSPFLILMTFCIIRDSVPYVVTNSILEEQIVFFFVIISIRVSRKVN